MNIENKGLAKVIDIETSDLLANMLDFSSFPYKLKPDAKLHVVVIRDAYTDELFVAEGSNITKEWMKESLKGCKYLIQHNGVKFDLICLKLFGVLDYSVGYLDEPDTIFGEEVKLVDTLILSRLFNPDRFGNHSLESWGERTGCAKMDFRGECIKRGIIPKDSPKGFEFKNYTPLMTEYCITPDMRLMGKDLLWKEANTFKVGDTVLGFDEESQENRKGRRYRNSKIEGIKEDYAEVFEVLLESGKVLKVTKEHRFLVCHRNHGKNNYAWVETKDLRPKMTNKKYYSRLPCLMPIYEQETSFDAGWLSGMFDGEGTLGGKGFRPPTLSVAQRPTNTLEKLERLLRNFDINISKRIVKKNSDCVSLQVNGGLSEVYRTLSLLRPERLISKLDFDYFGRLELKNRSFEDAVVSITSIGLQKILKIQTDSRTFMCEGYPMHNCILDTEVGKRTFFALVQEKGDYKGWDKAIKMEHKLADLAIRRESLGFWFDKDLAIKCVEDLTQKMDELRNKVNPILPPKPMTKTELNNFTPPNTQFLKSGKPSTHIIKFAERIGAKILENQDEKYFIEFDGNTYELPFNLPLKTHIPADISNLDHVKGTLIDIYNWIPTEWAIRDFTKDSKKTSLPYEKRVTAFERWLKETEDGKYKKLRLEIAFKDNKVKDVESLRDKIIERLNGEFPVRLPTSPRIRTGVEKELCPNLTKLGEQVEFANDFALFLTYKHRKSCIAGGEIEDMDFETEEPLSGYLSMYREEDGRVPTPAIEIGASTNRYRHIGVANIPRASSIYGKEMRSLFGCGKNFVQTGFDFSSLEARVQGHYVKKYQFGEELAESLVAEKPDDIHSVNSRKLGIDRGTVKSVTYAILYGCSPKKLEDMLGYDSKKAKQFYDDYWDAVPALRDLKKAVEDFWDSNGKDWIPGIDGRKLNTRSKHSLINLLFQSCGVIAAKYVTVILMRDMERKNYCTNPFEGKPDICSMIEYHDENQLLTSPNFYKFEVFQKEEEAKEFVKNWDSTKGQLSATGHSDKGYYITLPNDVSNGIQAAITETQKLLNLNVNLGFEWITGKNWFQCH